MASVGFDVQAATILELLGGKENVVSHTNCMTRLRVKAKDDSLVKVDEIKALDYVLQVQEVGGIFQIVIGPGKVTKVEAEFSKLRGNIENVESDEPKEKEPFKTVFLGYVQKIMFPIIPVLMGSALLTAVLNIIKMFGFDATTVAVDGTASLIEILALLLYTMANLGIMSIGVFIAISASKAFNGKPYLPVFFALFIYFGFSAFPTGVQVGPLTVTAGMGGMISVLIITFIVVKVEVIVRKFVPDVVSIIFVPFLTILVGFIALFVIVYPIAMFFTAIVFAIVNFFISNGQVVYILGNMALGASWPLLVLSGTHGAAGAVLLPYYELQGFTPLMASAMLFPATVTGAGLGSLFKYRKNQAAVEVNLGGSISSFLGITEPLIYGSLLPNGKNFFLTLLAGGIGGFFVGLYDITLGYGVPGVFIITGVYDPATMLLPYALIWFGTILVAFLLVVVFGKKQSANGV